MGAYDDLIPRAVAAGAKPPVPQMDGSISTEKTITVEADGRHFVIPTIINGTSYTPDAAADAFMAKRIEPLADFGSADEARTFAESRSRQLDAAFGGAGVLRKGDSRPASGRLETSMGGAYDDLIPAKRDVGVLESAGRSVMERGAQFGKVAGLATSAPFALYDMVGNLFRDQPSHAASDFAFSRFVDPSQSAKEHWQINPATETQRMPAKIASAVAPMALDLPIILGTGGTAAPLAAGARTLGEIVGPMFAHAGRAMSVPAGVTGAERAMQLTEEGVPLPRAVGAGAVRAGATLASGAVPLSAPGNVLTRAITGGASGAGTGEIQRIAENLYLPQGKEQPFDWENVAVQAAPGAVLGGVLGPRTPPRVTGRADVPAEPAGVPAADFERFRPILEANGIADPQSIAAMQAVAALRAREARQQAQAAQRAAEPQQPPTPAEQVPQVRPRPETIYVNSEGRAINPEARGDIAGLMENEIAAGAHRDADARRAFDVAERQRERKQEAQDEASLTARERDLREARAGGSTSEEGTAATTPERFTFLDAKVRDGQMAEGERVDVLDSGFFVRNEAGKDVPASRVRTADGREVVVADARLSEGARPANPRFAQDIAQSSYAPPRGVGTGEQQPQPRTAAQRITTGESPELLQAGRGKVARTPREGQTYDGEGAPVREPAAIARPGSPAPEGEAPPARLPAQQQPRLPAPPAEAAPAPEQPAAAPPPAAPAAPRPRKVGPRKPGTNFLMHVQQGGGIDPSFALEVGRDSAMELNKRRPGLFRKGGMSEDGLLEWLTQHGYLSDADVREAERQPGGSLQLAKDTVRRALDGEDVHTAGERQERAFASERDQAAELAEDRALQAEELARDELPAADADDMVKVARAAEIDEAAVERAAIAHEGDDVGFRSAIEEILNVGERPQQANEARAGGEEVSPSTGREGPAARPAADPAERPGLDLEQPGADGLRARDAAARRDAEQRSRLENAPPPEDFRLEGSDAPQDKARAAGQQELPGTDSDAGTLFGGLPAPVGKALTDVIGWAGGDAKAWAQSGRSFWRAVRAAGGSLADSPVRRWFRAVFDTASGDMRALLRQHDSQAAQWVLDQFHTEAGAARATGEIYSIAVDAHVRSGLKRLDDALGKFIADGDDASLAQIANLVRNPSSIRAGTAIGDAANAIRKLLDEELKYMRAAGVDVGEVRGGYFPREFDGSRVMGDTGGFINAATQAFRESGLDGKAAANAARELHDGIVYGDSGGLFVSKGGQTSAPFLKGRVFDKRVDSPNHPLNRFLVSDPALVLPLYLQRAARRAEIARRFGDRFAHWGEEWEDARGRTQRPLLEQIREQGGGDIVGDMAGYIALAAGLRSPGASGFGLRAASALRTWGSLMFLEKATLSSLTEFIVPAMRTGNPLDAARTLKDSIADLVPKLRTGSADERRAFAEDLNIISGTLSDTINAARWTGGEPISKLEAKVLDKYFRRTGLHQWTEATRVAAADLARVFIRRQAIALGQGGRLARRHLTELGIAEGQQEGFARWLTGVRDGMPSAGDLSGPNGELYRVAVRRMVSQGIMNPDATLRPAYMRSSLGSLLGQLQSFNYAFYENVLKRNARLTKEAVTGEGYTAAERAQLIAPMLMLPMLVGAAYAIGEGRDALLGDPNRRKEETGTEKALKAVSRGSPVAPLDPLLNYATSARYQRSALDFFAGPVIGAVAKGADAMRDLFLKNSPNTNTAERQAAKAVYDLLIEPAVNLILAATPVAPITAAVTQAVGAGQAREELWVKPLAGSKRESDSRGF